MTDKCQLSDLLPNLPIFRRFFTNLPRSAAEVSVKQATVLFTDIECVTKTIVKVIHGPRLNTSSLTAEMLQNVIPDIISTDSAKVITAKEEVVKLCQDWLSDNFEELDWVRIKDLQLRNILDSRRQAAQEASERKCLACPNFLKHVRFHT